MVRTRAPNKTGTVLVCLFETGGIVVRAPMLDGLARRWPRRGRSMERAVFVISSCSQTRGARALNLFDSRSRATSGVCYPLEDVSGYIYLSRRTGSLMCSSKRSRARDA